MNASTAIKNEFAAEYYLDADLRLVQAIPPTATNVLIVDVTSGNLAEVLKHLNPARRVTALTQQRAEKIEKATCFDAIIECDLLNNTPPSDKDSFDCIALPTLNARYTTPYLFLEKLRLLLKPNGVLIASIDNLQHWQNLARLMRGECIGMTSDLLARTSTQLTRDFLDAGFLPKIVDKRLLPAPDNFQQAIAATVGQQGLSPELFAIRLNALQYFVQAIPVQELPNITQPCPHVTIGVCVNNQETLTENLLASRCLSDDSHEILTVEGATSAAEGLNTILKQAKNDLIVLVHQDVYLPRWWIHKVWDEYEKASKLINGSIGAMGVYGINAQHGDVRRIGAACDRDFLLNENIALPSHATSLDEIVLILRKGTPLTFDPDLGFHLYGTDICLRALEKNMTNLVINAPCHHNSQQGGSLPDAFHLSSTILQKKWANYLPIATPCAVINCTTA